MRRFRRSRVWECPCGNFRVVATRKGARGVQVDRLLGEHYAACPVAQADMILRRC